MIRAFFARRRDAKTKTLVGVQSFEGKAYNPVTGAVVPMKATAQLFVTDAGVRSVEVSDKALMQEPTVIAWLEWGRTPDGMTVCA